MAGARSGGQLMEIDVDLIYKILLEIGRKQQVHTGREQTNITFTKNSNIDRFNIYIPITME